MAQKFDVSRLAEPFREMQIAVREMLGPLVSVCVVMSAPFPGGAAVYQMTDVARSELPALLGRGLALALKNEADDIETVN